MRKWLRGGRLLALLLILLLLVGSILLALFSRRQISAGTEAVGVLTAPLQKGSSRVSGFFEGIFDYLYRYDDLQRENEGLKQELKKTQDELRDAQKAAAENESLRALLGLKEENPAYDMEKAEVIAVSTGNWDTVYTIDKGTVDGVEVNDCVVTGSGMVGYVSEVGATFAQVVTVLDPAMQAGAIASRTREVGIAQGSYDLMDKGRLKLAYLSRESGITAGDVIETSGLGEVFPKGIVIGTVEEVKPEKDGMSSYALLRPAVNFDELHQVFVIKDFGGAN